jgi:8-oxo-dGTP diphosphatase
MLRRHIRVVGAMIERGDGRYLLTQRAGTRPLPYLWEFPSARLYDEEDDDQGLQRELREELGVRVEVLGLAMQVCRDYPGYQIDYRVFRCRLLCSENEIRHLKVNDHRWVSADEMDEYAFPGADSRSVEKLLELDH